MTTEVREIIDRLKGLSPDEQALVVDELLSSLAPSDEATDALWKKEVEDRLKAYSDGRLKSISLDEVLAKYR